MALENINFWIQNIIVTLNTSFLNLGTFQLSLVSIFKILILFIILYFISSRVRRILQKRLSHFHSSKVQTVLSLFHYSVLTIGSLVILQSAGLDLSVLAVFAGAVGIGLGLGLQDITNNFMSGLIILFERPIKVGDRVEVKGVMGQVMQIGLRSTTVLTNDNISIIIPNSDFVTGHVVNWTHTDDVVRLRIPIGVSYNSDPKKVVSTLESVLNETDGVLKQKNSDVILDEFGDNSMNFILRVWTRDFSQKPGLMRHHINMAAWEALTKAEIDIPFPQLDVHIKRDK